MKSMSAPPVKVYGPAVLSLPAGFFCAATFGQQLEALYAAAAVAGLGSHQYSRMMRYAAKLLAPPRPQLTF